MAELPPPPPNTNLADNRMPELLTAESITFFFGVVGILLRFLTRHFSGAGYWLDDYFIIPPALMLVTIFGLAFRLDDIFGRHVWAVGYPAQVQAMGYAFADEIIYVVLLSMTKFSVLALYWRIFKTTNIRLPILLTGTIVLSWMIACLLVACLQCQPIEKEFDILIPGNCLDIKAYFLGNAIANILTDVILLVLPLQPIFVIQRPTSQKALVAGTFLCGGLIVVFSCLRLQALLSIDLASPDLTWNYTDTWIWSSIEANLAVFSVCLPTLRPLYKFLRTGSFKDQVSTVRGRSKGNSTFAGTTPQSYNLPTKRWDYMTADEVSV